MRSAAASPVRALCARRARHPAARERTCRTFETAPSATCLCLCLCLCLSLCNARPSDLPVPVPVPLQRAQQCLRAFPPEPPEPPRSKSTQVLRTLPGQSTTETPPAHPRHGRHGRSCVRQLGQPRHRHGHGARPPYRRRPARREPLCAGRAQELAGREQDPESAPGRCQERALGRVGQGRLCIPVAACAGEPAAARALPVARLHRGCLQLPPPAAGPDGQCQEEGKPAVLG